MDAISNLKDQTINKWVDYSEKLAQGKQVDPTAIKNNITLISSVDGISNSRKLFDCFTGYADEYIEQVNGSEPCCKTTWGDLGDMSTILETTFCNAISDKRYLDTPISQCDAEEMSGIDNHGFGCMNSYIEKVLENKLKKISDCVNNPETCEENPCDDDSDSTYDYLSKIIETVSPEVEIPEIPKYTFASEQGPGAFITGISQIGTDILYTEDDIIERKINYTKGQTKQYINDIDFDGVVANIQYTDLPDITVTAKDYNPNETQYIHDIWSVGHELVISYKKLEIGFDNASSSNNQITYFSNGKITSNSLVTVAGTNKSYVYADAFYENSDERLKNNIADLSISCDKVITEIKPKTFTYKHDSSNAQQIGVIAQDVQREFPELVTENAGFLTVDYSKLSVLAIGALQDYARIHKSDQERIEQLESEVSILKQELNLLKHKING